MSLVNDLVRVGPMPLPDGTTAPLRADKQGACMTSNMLGFYAEAAARGLKNFVSNAVAGVDHGASLTTTPPIILWNPLNSGKLLSIIRVGLGYVSGTLGAGFIAAAMNYAQPNAPTTGTELTPVNANGMFTRNPLVRAFTGSTLTAAPTLIRPLFNIAPVLATSAVQMPGEVDAMIDGSIVVPPGCAFAMQGVCGAAGTTPKVAFFIEWDEVSL